MADSGTHSSLNHTSAHSRDSEQSRPGVGTTSGASRFQPWILPGLIVLAGVILRIAAAQGELWLDEVWSIVMLRESVTTPLEILTKLRHDNNHFLNSFWIWCLPSNAPDLLYRIPSLVAGSLVIPLACLIWRQEMLGRDEMDLRRADLRQKTLSPASVSDPRNQPRTSLLWIPALLFSVSILPVQYSSEARGYGSLCFFVLAAHCLQKRLTHGSSETPPEAKRRQLPAKRTAQSPHPDDLMTNASYTACCCLGFLSHATFLQYWLPATLVAAMSFRSRTWLFQIILPGSFFLLLWLVNLQGMQTGGGTVRDYFSVLLETMSFVIGSPAGQSHASWNAVLMLMIFLPAVVHCYRHCRSDFVILAGSTVIVPAFLLVIMGRADIYPRYFLVGTLFLCLALSSWLTDLCFRGRSDSSRWQVISGMLILSAIVAGHLTLDSDLLSHRRSHYQDALRRMTAEQRDATEGTVLVGVDHPFRHAMMLAYYMPTSELRDRIQLAVDPSERPEWFLQHDILHTDKAPETIQRPNGQEFTLVQEFPSSPLSGWDLLLYRSSSGFTGDIR